MDFPAKNPSRMAGVVHFQLALSNYSWSWGWTTQRRIAKPSVASGKPLRPLMVVVNSLSSSPKKWLDSYLWLFMGFGHCWPSTLGACWPFWGGKTDDQARSLVANNLCSPPSASGNEGCQTNQEFGCQQLFSRAIGLHSCRPGASVKRMSNGFIPTGLNSLLIWLISHHQNCSWAEQLWFSWCWLLLASVLSSWSGEPRMPRSLSWISCHILQRSLAVVRRGVGESWPKRAPTQNWTVPKHQKGVSSFHEPWIWLQTGNIIADQTCRFTMQMLRPCLSFGCRP